MMVTPEQASIIGSRHFCEGCHPHASRAQSKMVELAQEQVLWAAVRGFVAGIAFSVFVLFVVWVVT